MRASSRMAGSASTAPAAARSEEHTSELQSQSNLVCRLLLEKKKIRSLRCCGPTRLQSPLNLHNVPTLALHGLRTSIVAPPVITHATSHDDRQFLSQPTLCTR